MTVLERCELTAIAKQVHESIRKAERLKKDLLGPRLRALANDVGEIEVRLGRAMGLMDRLLKAATKPRRTRR